jgi:hypothetical protein
VSLTFTSTGFIFFLGRLSNIVTGKNEEEKLPSGLGIEPQSPDTKFLRFVLYTTKEQIRIEAFLLCVNLKTSGERRFFLNLAAILVCTPRVNIRC